MGIQGLLNLLKPATEKQHLSTFKGKRIAVDGLPWLYKGCYGYTFQLNQNVQTNEYVYFLLQMLQLLSMYKIKPILVFDGRSLKKKASTLESRAKNKEQNRQKALQSLKKDDMIEARKYFSRCIIIDQRIIATTFDILRAKQIQFMVAPYEADSQIGMLIKCGYADCAITEDSDLLLYNVPVILKLKLGGQCDFIDLKKVQKKEYPENPALRTWLGFSRQQRVMSCVLCGCDYLDNIHGIGIKKAINYVDKYKSPEAIVESMAKEKSLVNKIPQNYASKIQQTMMIFLCAKVFNPQTAIFQHFQSVQLYNRLKFSTQTIEQLVGKDYDYSKQVRQGTKNCQTMEVRQEKSVNFKTFMFKPIDKTQILVKEVRHQMHQRDLSSLSEVYTQEQIKQAKKQEQQERQRQELRKLEAQKIKKEKQQKLTGFLDGIMESLCQDEGSRQSEENTQPLEDLDDSINYSKLNPFLKK